MLCGVRLSSRDETLKQMWPDGAQSITKVTKRPVTAGMDFKNSIVALVEKNLCMKVVTGMSLVVYVAVDVARGVFKHPRRRKMRQGNPWGTKKS